ncbi:MAG: hypothetical protein ACTMIY_10735 [Microbacterium gubbeenense]
MTSQTPVSGEIWFKTKRVLRTAVQVIVGVAGALGVFVLVAPQVLDAVADVLPASWVAAAAAFIAGAAAISAALSRVMAIPAVDAWLKRIGLGSAPASAPVVSAADPFPSAAAAIDTSARTREHVDPDDLTP